MTTTTSTTRTTTLPLPSDACPSWCTGTGHTHTWEPDDDGYSRMHSHDVGMFSVMQIENITAGGRTFDAPTGDTCLDTFDSAQDARDMAADLETVARLMESIEVGAR